MNVVDFMEKIEENLKHNEFSDECVEKVNEFNDIITSIYNVYNDLEKNILEDYNKSEYRESEKRVNNSRMDYIKKLKAKFDEMEVSDYSDNIPKDYIYKMAYATEMINNIAHVTESYYKHNVKKVDLKGISRGFFSIKEELINQIAVNGKDKKDYGIIIGLDNDECMIKNKDVFVLDLAGKGQLSWHINNNQAQTLKNKTQIEEYKYQIDKTVMERMGNLKNRNSQMLCYYDLSEKNIHNRLVADIPEGCEDELEFALDLYYEMKNNTNQYIQPEAALREACELAGKVPSNVTFEVLLKQVFDTQYSDYDKKGLIKWRDDYERRGS